LDHGLSYYSLYGHCSSFLAAIGDLVEAEQPLAVAGDIGSLKGVTLYLEIRNKAKPLDPLKWLTPR
ncbi:MAG TPA: peptidoglycan DD-metalloendopeptidase family protein, partial [Acidobacteriota bacterium]